MLNIVIITIGLYHDFSKQFFTFLCVLKADLWYNETESVSREIPNMFRFCNYYYVIFITSPNEYILNENQEGETQWRQGNSYMLK